MKPERFGDLVANRIDRIERGHRLLKDHGDVATAYGPQAGIIGCREIDFLTVTVGKGHGAADDPATDMLDQIHDRQGGNRLARPGFPDNGQRPPGHHGKAEIVDDAGERIACAELDRKPLDREDG